VAFLVLVLQVVDARVDDLFFRVRFLEGGFGGKPGRIEDREAAAEVAGDDRRLVFARFGRRDQFIAAGVGTGVRLGVLLGAGGGLGRCLFLRRGRRLRFARVRFAKERLGRARDRPLLRVDVARPEFGREVDLVDFGAFQFVEQVEQGDQFVRTGDVGGRVFGQGFDQPVFVGDQGERRDLMAGLGEEALLARRADDVEW
jgi:hypothetical protein